MNAGKEIVIPVKLDEKTFRRFARFDTFILRKKWIRPVIFSLILIMMAGLILRSAELMQKVQAAAGTYVREGIRYTEGLRPEDLIHIGSFLQAWIPGKN